MTKTTPWGFPSGRVAETLRKILAPDLTDNEVEAIVVCLFSHLLLESSINNLLYRWLSQDAPIPSDDESLLKAKDALWDSIVKMAFAKKYSLVEPYFALYYREAAKTIWKINDLRNHLFHRGNIRNAKYDDRPFSEEKTVEKFFHDAQFAAMDIQKFEELIDSPHALAERWRDRLKALGEPLI